MIRTVSTFKEYVRTGKTDNCLFVSCIMAIKQGLLHVDATNRFGETVGVLFVACVFDGHDLASVLWNKYWTLGPDVATFWSKVSMKRLKEQKCRNILIETPALWTDLGLVRSFVKKRSWWLKNEVRRRIRASLRFAWIAAVAVPQV